VRDNPEEIADHLEKEHGLKEAMAVVDNGKREASLEGNNYTLSVWREVKALLQNRANGDDGERGYSVCHHSHQSNIPKIFPSLATNLNCSRPRRAAAKYSFE